MGSQKATRVVLKSNEMLKTIIRKDTAIMKEIIQEAHDINIPIIKYNDENSLACIVALSYLSTRDDYKVVVR